MFDRIRYCFTPVKEAGCSSENSLHWRNTFERSGIHDNLDQEDQINAGALFKLVRLSALQSGHENLSSGHFRPKSETLGASAWQNRGDVLEAKIVRR